MSPDEAKTATNQSIPNLSNKDTSSHTMRPVKTIGVDVQAVCRGAVFAAIRESLLKEEASHIGESPFTSAYSSLSDVSIGELHQRHFDTAISNYFSKSGASFLFD